VLVVEHVGCVALREKEVAIDAREVAVDPVVMRERLDEVDCGGVRCGGNARAFAAVHARDFDVAVVDFIGEMRGRARCFSAADLSIVDDDDSTSFEREEIGRCQSRDSGSDYASLAIG